MIWNINAVKVLLRPIGGLGGKWRHGNTATATETVKGEELKNIQFINNYPQYLLLQKGYQNMGEGWTKSWLNCSPSLETKTQTKGLRETITAGTPTCYHHQFC